MNESRDPALASALADYIRAAVTRPWTIMEVYGTHRHAAARRGLQRLLPSEIELVHGPACPVCATPPEMMARALAIASRPNVVLVSLGDMLHAPGSYGRLPGRRARGADVRVVSSPLAALEIAAQNRRRQVVFFSVGFETSALSDALIVRQAARRELDNFSMLVSHVLVPPMTAAILQSPGNRAQAFLAPGQVCAVAGYREYEALANRHRVPIVVSDFDPLDVLAGILRCVRQLEASVALVENQYARGVRRDGNAQAKAMIDEVFEVTDRVWRGVGSIPKSGLQLRRQYHKHDAARLFDVDDLLAAPRPASTAPSAASEPAWKTCAD